VFFAGGCGAANMAADEGCEDATMMPSRSTSSRCCRGSLLFGGRKSSRGNPRRC
jgi:hypothetical protein